MRSSARQSGARWWSERCAREGFWLTPEESLEAQRLLASARSDFSAAQLLASAEGQSDDVVGFHCQQAVEKSLKATLVSFGIEIPYVHDLSFLLEMVSGHASHVPEEVRQTDWLTPWAVAARYGAQMGRLDRPAATAAAAATVEWARQIVGSDAQEEGSSGS